MTPEQIQEIVNYLKQIGESVVTKGFEIAMRQVYVGIAVAILICVVSIIVLVFGIWVIVKGTRKDFDEEDWYAVGSTILVIATFFFFYNLGSIVVRLINPEWYAIQNIMKLIP